MRRTRALSVLLAATLGGLGTGAGTTPVGAASSCGHRHGPWTIVDPPAFPASAASHTQAGVADMVPGGSGSRLFATNGDTIMRSTNLGCSWSTVFSLDPTRDPSAVGVPDTLLRAWPDAVITSVVAAGPTVAYALIRGEGIAMDQLATEAGAPLFWAVSTNGGTSWKLSVVEAPSAAGGQPVPVFTPSATPSLYVAPSDPRTVYLSLNATATTPAPAVGEVASIVDDEAGTPALSAAYQTFEALGTTNGGASWYVLGESLNTVANGRLVVDPSNPRTLWAYGSSDWGSQDGVVSQSTNGGRTWYAVPRAPHTLGTRRAQGMGVQWLDAVHPRGAAARLLMNWPDGGVNGTLPPPKIYASTNGGRTWKVLPVPPTLNAWGYVSAARPRWVCAGSQDVLALAELQNGAYFGAANSSTTTPAAATAYRFLRLHHGRWSAVATPGFPVQTNASVSYSDFRSTDSSGRLFVTAYVSRQQTTPTFQTATTVTSYGLLYTGGC